GVVLSGRSGRQRIAPLRDTGHPVSGADRRAAAVGAGGQGGRATAPPPAPRRRRHLGRVDGRRRPGGRRRRGRHRGGRPGCVAMKGRRLPAILVLVALFVAGALVDRSQGSGRTASVATAQPAVAGLMPTAAPVGALNATWYCPAAPATPGGPAGTSSVTVLNPTDKGMTARITAVPSTGAAGSKTVPLPVPARSRASVTLSDIVAAPSDA